MTITKIVGVFIRDKKYLIVRDGDEASWKNVGGTVEQGESDMECLKRELMEELQYELTGEPELVFEVPPTPAVSDPSKTVVMRGYLVSVDEDVEFIPSGELLEIGWVNTQNQSEFQLSPQLVQYILPALREAGLID